MRRLPERWRLSGAGEAKLAGLAHAQSSFPFTAQTQCRPGGFPFPAFCNMDRWTCRLGWGRSLGAENQWRAAQIHNLITWLGQILHRNPQIHVHFLVYLGPRRDWPVWRDVSETDVQLDGVGPVDNRPSTDMWHVICDTWHMTCLGWWTFSQKWHIKGMVYMIAMWTYIANIDIGEL